MRSFFVALIILSFSFGKTQTFPQIEFQTFTDQDGLVDQYCNKVVQDKNGLIWVGTKNGISRYDGSRFKSFTGYFKGKNTIRLGSIYNMLPLENGGIWIGSNEQLFYFNSLNESFFKADKKGGYIYSDKQKAMLKMSDNCYLLPDKVNKEKPILKAISKGKNDFNKYYQLINDKKGNIWSWGNDYLVKIDKKTKKITQKYSFKNKEGRGFTNLYFDSKNRLWVSTWGNGVFIFNPKTKNLDRVETVFKDGYVALGFSNWNYQGKNYVVVLGDVSLLLIDEVTLKSKMYEDKEGRFRVYDALHDKQGNLWLATEFGLKFINSKQNFYQVFPIVGAKQQKNNFQKAVTNIYQYNNNFFVAKRWFDGLYVFDKNWKIKQHIEHFEPQINKDIYENSSEILGISTIGQNKYFCGYYGLYKLSENGKLKRITPKGFKENEELFLEDIIPENNQVWWIKYKKGVFKFNPMKDEFIENYVFPANNNKLEINSIFLTKNKNLLLGTSQGLFYLNPKENKFQKINIEDIKDESFYSICEDSHKNIWVMLSNSFVGINFKTKKIIYQSVPQLKINYGKNICADKYDNIWFHTNEGYCCYIQKEKQIAKYEYKIGLPDNRLEWFSMEMKNGEDGYVYAGARDAVIRFDPQMIKNHQSKVKVLITDIELNEKRYNSKIMHDGSEELHLPPGNYLFNLSFSIPDYTAAKSYELFYNFSNNKEKWIKSEDGTIRFSNLSKGNYVIRLQGKNNLTGKFTSVKIIHIFVAPFWYQAWWFYTFVIISTCLIVWGITRYFWLQRLKEQRFKRKIQESEMKTLRSQMNPHFMFNTLNAINNFIVKNNTNSASEYLSLFSKLMRNILENSEQEFISLEKELQTLKMYLRLEQVRLNNAFNFEITIDETLNEENLKVPPLILQPYCENAIWHGLRNKNNDGFLKITINQSSNNHFQFIIEDDGIGRIESAKLKKNETEHKSYGMQITEQRLHMINSENSVTIVDLYDDNGLARGTRIIINLTEIE